MRTPVRGITHVLQVPDPGSISQDQTLGSTCVICIPLEAHQQSRAANALLAGRGVRAELPVRILALAKCESAAMKGEWQHPPLWRPACLSTAASRARAIPCSDSQQCASLLGVPLISSSSHQAMRWCGPPCEFESCMLQLQTECRGPATYQVKTRPNACSGGRKCRHVAGSWWAQPLRLPLPTSFAALPSPQRPSFVSMS